MAVTRETSGDDGRQRQPLVIGAGRRLPKITVRRLIVAGVLLGVVAWLFAVVSSVTVYSTQLVVVDGNAIGIPPPTASLDFGDVPRGGQLERSIRFENSGIMPTAVLVIEWGGARDFTRVSDASFSLGPGEEKTVTFDARPPASAPAKAYKGKVIVLRIPWPF